MTYEKPRFNPPAGPTPEEISARLEALLKRTHALRRAQATPRTGDQPDEGPTWPPSDRDMAAVEVVDVPASDAGGPMAATPPKGAAPPPQGTSAHTEGASRGAPAEPRPDWSTLGQRDAAPSPPTTVTPGWVWPVIAVLAVALAAETAYLVWTAPWAVATVSSVTAAPASAPVEAVTTRPAEPSAEPPTVAQADPAQPEPGQTDPAQPSADPAQPTAAPPTATIGAVRIESDPPGALVIMEGRERGVTPITIGQLRPGRHDVIVERPGEDRLDLKVDITAGQTTRLDASGRPPVQR